ncbi:bile acid:sodium symporter family protein [Marinilabilia sp.]
MKKILFIGALVSLILFLVSIFVDQLSPAKSLLIIGFACLALASGRTERFKGFAYSLWIVTAVCASMSYPAVFKGIGTFQFKLLIVPLLQIIMFGMGSQMSLKDFAGVIKMPKGVIIGVISQFTIMPVIGITIATMFDFPPEIAAGIVLVGSSPSGMASNVMSFIAKANLALSVTLTAFATVMSPLLTPFLMKVFAGQLIEINFWNMMLGIFNMVILPICAGLIFNLFLNAWKSNKNSIVQIASYLMIIFLKNFIAFETTDMTTMHLLSKVIIDMAIFAILPVFLAYIFRYFAKGDKKLLDKILSLISMLGIGIIITVITAAGRDSLREVGFILIIGCFLHNMFGYSLGYGLSKLLRMKEEDCRTIAFEVGMQNGGLASGLALEMGKVATVGLAPAVFGPMMNITGSSLASFWRKRIPKEIHKMKEK